MNKIQIKKAEEFFIKNFSASKATKEECSQYLDADETLLLGLIFTDVRINFSLMTETDFLCFPEKEAERIRKEKASPDKRILLIFYEKNFRADCKLINGNASRLFEYAEKFLD